MTRIGFALGMAIATLTLAGCVGVSTERVEPEREASVPTQASDEFDGYFDDVSSAADAVGADMSWGSFGAPGEVVPVGWISQGVTAGEYILSVECVGPQTVEFWAIGEADAALKQNSESAHSIACPSSESISINVDDGWTIQLDSHGDAGAYRITVAPVS